MIACEFNNILGRYHDGELAGAERRRVEDHLRECAMCAGELEQMRAISQSLRSGAAERAPRVSADFLARLQALGANVERQTVIRFVTRLTAAAAAILVAATIQWAVLRPHAGESTEAPLPGGTPASTTASLGPEEQVILDPDSAVASAGNDNASVGDPLLDVVSPDLSGGRQ